MKKIVKTVAGLAVLSSAAAFAQTSSAQTDTNPNGVYLGGNYGYLKVDGDDNFDDDKDVFQGLIGYRLAPFFAVEGSFIDFGSYGNSFAKADTDGYTLGIKGILPITDAIELYAKLGQLWWETDYRVANVRGDTDDEGMYFGGGLAFKLSPNLVLNAEYLVYDADFDVDDAADDIDDADENFKTDFKQASVGIEYRF